MLDSLLQETMSVKKMLTQMSSRVLGIGQKKNKDTALESIFTPSSSTLHKWKTNIVGDDQLIVDNMNDLLTGIGQKKNKDTVLESIFTPSSSTLHKWKTNIVGDDQLIVDNMNDLLTG